MANKETMAFRIYGRVINRKIQQGVEGLRIEAWDKDRILKDPVGSDFTDKHGTFRIAFSESYLRNQFGGLLPDLFFRIFQDSRQIQSTEGSVLWNVAAGTRRINIEVDIPVEETPRPRLPIDSLAELLAHEKEILERIQSVRNGGHLFLLHPFLLLTEVGVELSDRAHREMVQQHPGLSALSIITYEALKNSKENQRIRCRILGLSHGRSL